ncbi:GTPase-associated system all-helical protein GASH [Frigoribacterium sp. PhB116]|uniref:GTPase-associated system all-helical protein GASH n=1 Tax=Frigoribacterium sp. PhB116 TaxID=2485174 RepID=UPI00106039D5|nr:GTPase-associated system all-helical protein GASH [Frigoribacterium sp. PhB116]TDT61721.1 hypothetical protein EDF20_3016 [Frigoribacterium sp. PhB116]
MIAGPTLDEMAQSLSRVSMEVSSDEVQRRLSAALEVVERISPLDVAAVAFGAPAPDAFASVEAIVQTHDSSWISGRRTEIVRVVAGTTIFGLLRQPDTAVLTALACQSAVYLGYDSGMPEVIQSAEQIVLGAGAQARSRTTLPPLGTAPSKLLAGQQELSGPDAVTAIRGLSRRFEEIITYTNGRLDRLDEEVNVLWWARKPTPNRLDLPWHELPVLTRIANAVTEVSEFVHIAPPTRGTIEVLSEVVGGLDQEESALLITVAEELVEAGWAPRRVEHHLLPLSTFVSAVRDYPHDKVVAASVVERSSGLAAARDAPMLGLDEQILREHAMLQVLA